MQNMDKPSSKLKHKLLALLPKATAPVISFKITAPRAAGGSKGSVLPVVSLVPKEARGKSRNWSFNKREPGSPRISCTGKVKSSRSNNQRKPKPARLAPQATMSSPGRDAKSNTTLKFRLSRGRNCGEEHECPKDKQVATPSMGQAKQFSGGRGKLSNFDS